MAERDDNEEETKGTLSPEERISKLEKNKSRSLIIIAALLFFSLIQFAGIGYLLIKSGKDPKIEENTVQLATLDARVLELQKAGDEAKQIMLQNELLKAKLDKVLEQASIHNYAKLRSTMVDQEISYMKFIEALQQGMYELSRMVRGSRTWFEVYKEELDKVLTESEVRIAKIEGEGPMVPSKAEP